MDEDVLFTFDPKSFIEGFDMMSEAMSALPKNFNIAAEKITASSETTTNRMKSKFAFISGIFTKGKDKFSNPFRRMAEVGKKSIGGLVNISKRAVSMIGDAFSKVVGIFHRNKQKIESPFNALIKKAALFGVAFMGIRRGMREIPEIGRSFTIAGNIITKNLLWPLRKQLIPLLQKMLDWVRDHRTMFVKWGGILVNIFMAIKSAIVGVVNIVKTFAENFINGIKRVLGVTTSSITDLINLAILKIAFLFQFIMITLEPVAAMAGKVIANLIGFFAKFFKGVLKGVGDIQTPVNDLWQSFVRLLETIGLIGDRTTAMGKAFKVLGILLGTIVRPIITAISDILDALSYSIDDVILGMQKLSAWWDDDTKKMAEITKEREKISKEFLKRNQERWAEAGEAFKQSAIEIIKTVGGEPVRRGVGESPIELPMPAAAAPVESKTVTQNNNINVTVQGTGKPEEDGAIAGQAIKQQLMDQRILAGAQ